MKNILQKIDNMKVLKTFALAHVFMFIGIVIVALGYVIVATISGMENAQIINYAESAGVFSVLGILAAVAAMTGVYRTVSKKLPSQENNSINFSTLEILFVVFSVILYFVVPGFNIFSYLVVMLIPTIAAYYIKRS